MQLTFRAKLLASHLAVVAAVVALTLVGLGASMTSELERDAAARLEHQALGAAEWVSEGRHPDKLAARLSAIIHATVTIFGRDGAVLGDSDHPTGSQPTQAAEGTVPEEVSAARLGRIGHAERVSTSSASVLYVAVPAPNGLILRLGAPLSEIEAPVRAMQKRLFAASLVAAIAAALFAYLASHLAARPLRAMTAAAARIAGGDYDIETVATSPDEFGALARALRSLAEQLKSDMERIRKLEVMRRDFVANVSHELRTPATAIQGYAETLLSGHPDPQTAHRFLETLHRQALRLGRLVDQLLQLSALEARVREGAAANERTDVGAIAGQVLETMRERIESAGVDLTVDIEPEAMAIGDGAHIEQAIENLVDNALKYGASGKKLEVHARRSGERVIVRVIDAGPGIPAEHRGRIFERFYRMDDGRSRDQGGAGLGLAIVKHLVESAGGTVVVEEGPGGRFRIELPAV